MLTEKYLVMTPISSGRRDGWPIKRQYRGWTGTGCRYVEISLSLVLILLMTVLFADPFFFFSSAMGRGLAWART